MRPFDVLFESGKVHLLVDPDHWRAETLQTALADRPPCVGATIVGGTYIHAGSVEPLSKICRESGTPVANLLSIGSPEVLLAPDTDFIIIPILIGCRSSAFLCDHVIRAVPVLRRLKAKTIAIAYLPLDGGVATSAQFFTQHQPIPRHKPEIIYTLAAAASYLGLSGIYLDAGSGARTPAAPEEVSAAREASQLPIVVGGGVRDVHTIAALMANGASSVIVGSALEETRSLSWLQPLSEATK